VAKQFEFINKQAKKEFLALPNEKRKRFSDSLNVIAGDQGDLTPELYREGDAVRSKVLKGAFSNVTQLSINGKPAYRTVYCAKFNNTVYILHSWTKTSEGTDRKAMTTLKHRLLELKDKLMRFGIKI
jgi:phage-related protein